jgi:hypothetical protein
VTTGTREHAARLQLYDLQLRLAVHDQRIDELTAQDHVGAPNEMVVQRQLEPVVLPECMSESTRGNGWKACIDEVPKLNTPL